MEEKDSQGNASVIVIIIMIGVVVVYVVANYFMGDLMEESVKRSCCIDAGGDWDHEATECRGGNEEIFQNCIE